MMRDRRGFSLIEVLMVMLVVGILSGIAVPIYRGVVQRADAARIISDVHTIHLALAVYFTERQTYPPSSAIGTVPAGLVEPLPDNFSFAHTTARYRYMRWAEPGTPEWSTRSGTGLPLVGVEVHIDNPSILRHVEALSQGRARLVGPTSLTLILE